MATNPMQRKARNSFLIGMLITLVITGVIIAFLFIQLTNAKKAQKTENAKKVNIYVLAQDKKSGDKLEYGDFIIKEVDETTISKDAIYSLGELFGEKNELIAKIDLSANTSVTKNMVIDSNEKITDDVRIQEYNVISLATGIENGDYVDIRLMLPSGQDFIVLSKKKVEIPISGEYTYISDTIRLQLSEAETLTMSSAIVEAWQAKGSKIYATKYVEAGMQNAAIVNYPPNKEVMAEIESTPNIVSQALTELRNRYNVDLRVNYITKEMSKYSEEANSNIESGMNTSVTKTQEDRKGYLETLAPTY